MAEFYIYFISSLPLLRFKTEPPFSSHKFIAMAKDLIPDKDLGLLRYCLNMNREFDYQGDCEVLRKWCGFNIALNNEIVKIRVLRRHLEAGKYLRQDGYAGFDVAHIVSASHRHASLIEAESMLDEARWNYLDELSGGHYFDLEVLIIYLQRLLILERWVRINTSNKAQLLQTVTS